MTSKKIADFLLTSKIYLNANKKFREASKISLTSAKLTILNKLGNKELIIPKQKGPNVKIIFLGQESHSLYPSMNKILKQKKKSMKTLR